MYAIEWSVCFVVADTTYYRLLVGVTLLFVGVISYQDPGYATKAVVLDECYLVWKSVLLIPLLLGCSLKVKKVEHSQPSLSAHIPVIVSSVCVNTTVTRADKSNHCGINPIPVAVPSTNYYHHLSVCGCFFPICS